MKDALRQATRGKFAITLFNFDSHCASSQVPSSNKRCAAAAPCGLTGRRRTLLPRVRCSWHTTLDEAVNIRLLSTGEAGELAPDNVGCKLNPGVELAPPTKPLFQPEKMRSPPKPAECWGYGRGRLPALLSTKQPLGVGAEVYWLPGMDSNHDSRLGSNPHARPVEKPTVASDTGSVFSAQRIVARTAVPRAKQDINDKGGQRKKREENDSLHHSVLLGFRIPVGKTSSVPRGEFCCVTTKASGGSRSILPISDLPHFVGPIKKDSSPPNCSLSRRRRRQTDTRNRLSLVN